MRNWMWMAGVGMLAAVQSASAATVYQDASSYQSGLAAAGGGIQTLLPFEDLPAATVLDDDYSGLGVRFSAPYGISLTTSVHGSAPRGTLGAQAGTGASPASFTLLFDAPQVGISLYMLDAAYTLTVQAYDAGGLKESFTLDAAGEDFAGGRYRGIVFALPITRVVITTQLSDGIGFDDLSFTSLDADGDGFGPGAGRLGGDCDDSDSGIYPGATEVVDNEDQNCDGVVDNAYGVFTSIEPFDVSVDQAGIDFLTAVDFEDLNSGDSVLDAYHGLGIGFSSSSAITASTDVSGSKPNGKLGASVQSSSLASFTLSFDEAQTHLSARLLDLFAPLSVVAYDEGGELYRFTLSAPGEDTAGGTFRGLSFYLPVTRVVFSSASTSDGIGFDDVEFVSLDLDGDGYGPGEGRRGDDCNDNDPQTYPGAVELSGDGIDQNCDGLIDNAVTIYTNPTNFQNDGISSGVPAFKKIDFEALAETTVINTQYKSFGVTLLPSTGVSAEKSIHGSPPRGIRGAKVAATAPGTFTWQFDEPQRFVSAYFLDISAALSVQAYRGSTLINTFSFTAPGEDLAGGIFRGFAFSQYVDKVVFTGGNGDGIGYDDLLFDPIDDDQDGFTIAQGDCNDSNTSVNPNATESCNGIDDDCDTLTDEGFDQDDDGWVSCSVGTLPADCNDSSPEMAPGLEEICDRLDNDCDELVDEGFDVDKDGYSSCALPVPDCNDNNASVKPGATETCNGIDDDCDGVKDEGFDQDGDGYYTCAVEGKAADCNDNSSGVNPGATELPYNGVDEDCSGADLTDVDQDGFAGGGGPDCNDNNASHYPGATETPYNGIDEDCTGSDLTDVDGDGFAGPSGVGADCDDDAPQSYPGAAEIDDDKDNDCDGDIDEDLDTTDDDDDGFSEAQGDCDDSNGSVHPGATEVAYNGLDDDCVGGDLKDVDGDGFNGGSSGSDCDDNKNSIYPGATEIPYNAVDEDCSGSDLVDVDNDGFSGASGGSDCNDGDASIYPGAIETPYDGIDQDCAGGDLVDVDLDGFDASQAGGTDCRDDDPFIYPGAEEEADGVDNDCDSIVDEGTEAFDDDEDGYSEQEGDCDDDNADIFPGASEIPYDGVDDDCSGADLVDVDGDGYAGGSEGSDCNDTASGIHPGVDETCGNAIDEDCDGLAEECPETPTPGGGEETPTPDAETPTPDPATPTPDPATPTPPDDGGDDSPTPADDGASGCTCDSGSSGPASSAGTLALAALALSGFWLRRRRS